MCNFASEAYHTQLLKNYYRSPYAISIDDSDLDILRALAKLSDETTPNPNSLLESWVQKIPTMNNNLAKQLAYWLAVKNPNANIDIELYKSIFTQYPQWPYQKVNYKNTERQAFLNQDANKIAWLLQKSPYSTYGELILLDSQRSSMSKQDYAYKVNQVIVNSNAYLEDDPFIISRYRPLLTNATLLTLVRNYLINEEYNRVPVVYNYLSNQDKKSVDILIGLGRKDSKAYKQSLRLPKGYWDLILVLQKIRYYNRTEATGLASEQIQSLLKANPQNLSNNFREQFWKQQHITSRTLIQKRKYSLAYQVINASFLIPKVHNSSYSDIAFLRGFLLFVYLKQPKQANIHFKKGLEVVGLPISIARFQYWIGRSESDPTKAQTALFKAMNYPFTFYGQMAGLELGLNELPVANKEYVYKPDSAKQIQDHYSFKAIMLMLNDTAAFHAILQSFVANFAFNFNSIDDYHAFYTLTQSFLPDFLKVTAGKQSYKINQTYPNLSYPLPYFLKLPIQTYVDASWLMAVGRQESVLNSYAVSSKNASGIIQLLPSTAKGIAKLMNMQFSEELLTKDLLTNIKIGSFYLMQLKNQYGTFPVALSAYNAGPPKTTEWLELLGAPKSHYEILNFIESLSYGETRNYIQRNVEGFFAYEFMFNKKTHFYIQPLNELH